MLQGRQASNSHAPPGQLPAGPTLAIMTVRVLPPSESCRHIRWQSNMPELVRMHSNKHESGIGMHAPQLLGSPAAAV